MGLLDQFSGMSDDQNMGLLSAGLGMMAASGPSRTPTNFGQVALTGLQGYQDSTMAARKRKLEADQAAQMGQLRGLQIQEAQGGLADHDRKRAQEDALRSFYLNQRTGQAPASAPDVAGAPPQMASAMPGGANSPKIGGPDWMHSFQASQPAGGMPQLAVVPAQGGQGGQGGQGDPYSQRMALAQQLRGQGFHVEADAQEKAALAFKPKFANEPRTVMGADGKPTLVQMADDGTVRPIAGGYGAATEMHFGDTGGALVGMDKYTGKVLSTVSKTATPDQFMVDARARQQLAQTERHWKAEQVGDGPDASDAMIDAIGQGKMAPPSGYALRNPKMLQMMERVATKYPEFDATEYDGKKKAMRDFTTGTQGNSIRSFAVATDHLTQLKGLIGALDNGDTPLINKYGNIIAQQTGSVAPTNFDAAKGIVAKEVLKSIVAGGGGVDERQELAHLLDNAKTTKQLNGVVDTYLHLMSAQKDGLTRQYELSTGRKDAAMRFNYAAPAAPEPAATKKSALKGQVSGGYRFKGGDPADQTNWEKI